MQPVPSPSANRQPVALPPLAPDMRHIAVRCPVCLVTIYTITVPGGRDGFIVTSLEKELLPYYNCPFSLCGYHVNPKHGVNLYFNIPSHLKISVSTGFTISPYTTQPEAFRSPDQVANLAITPDPAKPEQQKPPVPSKKAQAVRSPGEREKEKEKGGGPSTTSVPPLGSGKNKCTSGMRWTVSETKKLAHLANEGRPNDEIAQEMQRSTSSVKNKIAAMRDKGELPAQATPLKRKRENEGDDRPSST